jgi:putative toxin-antitoxin system antitoxin component (TIGR02293 family)
LLPCWVSASGTFARLDAKSKLDAVSGDRLVRSARLFALAAEVLEDSEAAARWLKSPQRALSNEVPLHLAGTDVGTRAVEALLGRMEHGVFT